jgi:mono/diheme cytochrome c family protein
MKQSRLLLTGCAMLFAVLILTIGGIYAAPTALADEYTKTSVAANSDYGDSNSGYKPPSSDADYTNNCDGLGYLPPDPNLTDAENRGRCTWYLWTAGNEKYYRTIAKNTGGTVDLLQLVDSRLRDERFKRFGAMNDPGCEKATKPDEYGLWLDKCKDPQSTGVIGLRKFDNPNFDPAKWNPTQYAKDASVEPPYRIGQSCAICHVALDPLNPPKDPEHPKWNNLVPALGNQFIDEGAFFAARIKPDDFRWHVLKTQEPGTSDTSRIATDHINNPNAINAIFNLGDRPKYPEVMPDGSTQEVNRILKDGADSTGVANASLRVYVNIGMCGDYWLSLHDSLLGRRPQKPFDIDTARKNCQDWVNTEARMADAESFLKTITPMHLKDAPGGEALLTKDEEVLQRGKIAFASTCATCHSSKQPPAEIAADPEQAKQWYIQSVLSSDFLDHNFLSDDKRYPVTLLNTNAARALGTNATKGHIWDEFSSKTYKQLPSPGKLTLENPFDESQPIKFNVPKGGVGYYRTPSLVSIWATAPFLHNNSLGTYIKDPSVEARVKSYTDSMEQLLWPENREDVIKRTSQNSTMSLPMNIKIPVPKDTPVNLIANINPADPLPPLDFKNLPNKIDLKLDPKAKLIRLLLKMNKSPDFIENKGHTFGSQLSDEDKKALIEFVKTF